MSYVRGGALNYAAQTIDYVWPTQQMLVWRFIMYGVGGTLTGIFASFVYTQNQLGLGVPWWVYTALRHISNTNNIFQDNTIWNNSRRINNNMGILDGHGNITKDSFTWISYIRRNNVFCSICGWINRYFDTTIWLLCMFQYHPTFYREIN